MSVERRFVTSAREADRDDPGLVQEDDGVVYVVKPDGTRSELPGSGGSQPASGQRSLLDGAAVIVENEGASYLTWDTEWPGRSV